MSSTKFSLSKMQLQIVESKQQFDKITIIEVVKKRHWRCKVVQTSNDQISEHKVQQDRKKQQNKVGDMKQIQRLSKIVPRWGYISKDQIITKPKQSYLNRNNNRQINFNGYHRILSSCVNSLNNDDLKQQLIDIDTKQLIKKLLQQNNKMLQILKNPQLRQQLKSKLTKIINDFNEFQWNNQQGPTIQLLINKLFEQYRSKQAQIIRDPQQNKSKSQQQQQFSIQLLLKQSIKNMLHQLYQEYKHFPFIGQNTLLFDKTINNKNKQFNTLPQLHKPFKPRSLLCNNNRAKQLKFMIKSFIKHNPTTSIKSLHNTKNLSQIIEQMKRNNNNEKQQSINTFNNIFNLAQKFKIQDSSEIQQFLIDKYSINKNQNYVLSQSFPHQTIQSNITEPQQTKYQVKKRLYVRKSYQQNKQSYHQQQQNHTKQKRQNRLIKTTTGWQRSFNNSTSTQSHQPSIYQQSQSEQQSTQQHSKHIQQSNHQFIQIIKKHKSINIKQVMKNLQYLISPQTNIFTYSLNIHHHPKHHIKENQFHQNHTKTQQIQKKIIIKSFHQKSFDKQSSNLSAQTFYNQEQTHINTNSLKIIKIPKKNQSNHTQ